jgi:hypothetical protein
MWTRDSCDSLTNFCAIQVLYQNSQLYSKQIRPDQSTFSPIVVESIRDTFSRDVVRAQDHDGRRKLPLQKQQTITCFEPVQPHTRRQSRPPERKHHLWLFFSWDVGGITVRRRVYDKRHSIFSRSWIWHVERWWLLLSSWVVIAVVEELVLSWCLCILVPVMMVNVIKSWP